MTITKQDVIKAYRYLLNREPDSEDVVNAKFEFYKDKDLVELLSEFTHCDEFIYKFNCWNGDLNHIGPDFLNYNKGRFNTLYEGLYKNSFLSNILEMDNLFHFLRDETSAKRSLGNYIRNYGDVIEVCAKISNLYDEKMVLPVYPVNDIGIVIQGPIRIEDDFTEKIVVWYRQLYPNIPIVVSTWKDKVDSKFKDICSRYSIFLLENDEPEYAGRFNVNYQLKSSLEGVKFLKSRTNVKYVLKSRSDQWFTRCDFLLYLKGLLDMYPVRSDVVKSRFVMNMSGNFPFFFADQFAFGDISDIFNLYSAPYETNEFSYLANHYTRFYKLNCILGIIKANISKNEFKNINDIKREWKKHSKFLFKFCCPEIYITSYYYNRFIMNIEPDSFIYDWLNFLKNYVIIPDQLYIYWPKYEQNRLCFWGLNMDSRQWQTFCETYSTCECKDLCIKYWAGKVELQNLLDYANRCKYVADVEYLARFFLHEKSKLQIDFYEQIDNTLDRLSSRLLAGSFIGNLLQLEKSGNVKIKKEPLKEQDNLVLLLEILERKNMLAGNESVIKTVCAGDNMRNMILEVFLRISRDRRVRFFTMKDEAELWIQYVPFLTEENKKLFPVVKNESGKTWPWTDENNYSAFAAYIKLVNDGIYLSIEFCTENVEESRHILENFSLYEKCNYVDNHAVIQLMESTMSISNGIEISNAVNKSIDAFCDVGLKIMGGK